MNLKARLMASKRQITLAFLIAIPLFLWAVSVSNAQDQVTIETANGQIHRFEVEIARTTDEMATGLMNRLEMESDKGMLFVFPDERERSFWMKNTLIPLDIIFIKKGGSIGHIHEMAIPLDETGIPSQGPAAAVLEINGGTAAALGIAPGDKARHPDLNH